MGNLYFDISTFPGKPSDSQMKEAARIHAEMAKVKTSFETMLTGPVASLNAKLDEAERISWTSKADFLAAEAGGSDAGSQRQRWSGNALWKDALQNPLGALWVQLLQQ